MFAGQMIFFWRAKIGCARGVGGVPALTIVGAPRMHHDQRGIDGLEMVRHFDDSARIVREPPRANVQIGICIIYDCWSFEPNGLPYWFHKLGKIG